MTHPKGRFIAVTWGSNLATEIWLVSLTRWLGVVGMLTTAVLLCRMPTCSNFCHHTMESGTQKSMQLVS